MKIRFLCSCLLFLLISTQTVTYAYNGNDKEWDYIIVGDGTAAAPLARKLSDDFKHKVLVLEWGKNRTEDPFVLSPDVFAHSADLTYDPKYAVNHTIPLHLNPANNDYYIYSDGRMWGGCSAHNGLFAVRGTPTLYNLWAKNSDNTQWSYASLLPFMLSLENYHATDTIANTLQRGTSGPLDITQRPSVSTDPFAIAVSAGTGSPLVNDYNDPTEGEIGISAHQEYITPPPNSHRSFSALAFHPVGSIVDQYGIGLNDRKLFIISNALVGKVIFENKKAIGVEYLVDGKHANACIAYARKKIILSAGANITPAILQRSGIGDKTLLESLGIKVIVDNPNVGAHLSNHYGVSGLIFGSTSATPFLHGYIDARPYMPADNARRLQLIGINQPSLRGVSLSGTVIQPHSEGSVKIVDKNPTVYPKIDLNLYSDGPVTTPGTDAYLAVSFFKILKQIAASFDSYVIFPPVRHYPAPFGPATDDSLLLADAKTLSTLQIAYHNAGTARMSKSITDGVVDGQLHVFGVKNLMVADVSVEPVIQDGNTAYAAYLIGLVAANIILN